MADARTIGAATSADGPAAGASVAGASAAGASAAGPPAATPTDEAPLSRGLAWLLAAQIVLMVAFVFAFRFIPLQDYPEWLLHGVILRTMIAEGAVHHGAYALHAYVPPNAISTLLIAAFNFVVPAEPAGKAVLVSAMILLHTGIVRFMRATLRGHDALVLWAAFLFVFNYTFWLGNLSFYIGMGVALHGGHLLVRRGWGRSVVKMTALVALAYLCHFFAWFFVLFIAAVNALLDRSRAALLRLAAAAVPSLVLFVHYLLVKGSTEAPELPTPAAGAFIAGKLMMFAGAIIPFQRFKGVAEPSTIVVAGNYLFITAMGALIVLAAWRFARERRLDLNIALALPLPLLILGLPPLASGIVFPGQRLVLFLMINVIAYVAARYHGVARWGLPLFAAAAVAAYAYGAVNTARFNEMAAASDGAPPASYLAGRAALAGKGGTDGFIRLEYYRALDDLRPMPLFGTALVWADSTKVPGKAP